jgi:hypothetical protein
VNAEVVVEVEVVPVDDVIVGFVEVELDVIEDNYQRLDTVGSSVARQILKQMGLTKRKV